MNYIHLPTQSSIKSYVGKNTIILLVFRYKISNEKPYEIALIAYHGDIVYIGHMNRFVSLYRRVIYKLR